MAALDNFGNMYDIAMKPLLLRSLLRDQIPDEKRPFHNPSKLLQVISTVKTHALLSERYDGSADQLLHVKKWKSAVNDWVDRLLVLVSSDVPLKCWAGISLLGVTCEEGHSDRILASHSDWLPKLLSHIQSPVDSHIVKLAACTTISDLFTRLGGVPSVKKDGDSHAGKVVQPLLKILNEDSSESVWEGAIHLLCTVLAFFPSSVHRHSDSVEAAIILKMKSGKCSETVLKKLAQCLALLPKSKGDEDTWILMMHKILLSINGHLNDAFQGLEDETKSKEAMRLLAPPGKELPPPLGGHTTTGEALDTIRKSERMAISNVSTLMLCCSTMLTSYYSVQVSVPVSPVLALVRRVLTVDGSVSQSMYSFMSITQQQLICSQLPVLHMYSLDLLTAIIKGLRSQLLPHAAEVVRLLTEYFRRCALPELRIKVYSIVKILLISMGLGIAVYLAPDIISNASLDLNTINYENNGISDESNEPLLQSRSKKRKQGSLASSHEEKNKTNGPEKRTLNGNLKTPNSVKIAALEALESLLNVGGASRSESWRSNVDLLLMTVATYACGQRLANQETNPFLCSEHTSTWEEFQFASLRALLASLLSRARVRPPYLAQGLELFHRGKQETGTRLSEFCAHALLALEVLMHPRARALGDFDEGDTTLSENLYSMYSQNQKIPFSDGAHDEDLDEDYLDRTWQENEYDSGADNVVKGLSQNLKNPAETNEDEIMTAETVSIEKCAEIRSVEQKESISDEAMELETEGNDAATETGPSDSVAEKGPTTTVPLNDDLPMDEVPGIVYGGPEAEASDLVAEKRPTPTAELNDESSDYDFPPLVDAPPDSDSD